jgi:hypothetical protein
MSNGVGEHLFTFAYLSLLTGSICGWKLKLLQQLHGPTQVSHKARPHTQLVCMDHRP